MRKTSYIVAAMLALGSAAQAQRPSAADSLYGAGRAALSAAKLQQAVTLLKKVVDQYPSASIAGDALYWRAYAQYQLGIDGNRKSDLEEALAALDKQRTSYAKASTASDARELTPRIQAALAKLGDAKAAEDVSTAATKLGTQKGCPSENDDLRIAALDGVMQMDAVTALPILTQVMKNYGNCSETLRKHAVFVVSQMRGDDAATLLLTTARSDPSADVRAEAVQWLGQTKSERATAALDSILFNTKEHDLRDKALFALSQQRTPRAGAVLRRAADDDRVPADLRGQAVFWLGDSRLADLEFFQALFKKSKAHEVRDQIFMAVGNLRSAEASRWMLDVAKDKTIDMESRKNAIFQAGERKLIDLDALSAVYDAARGEDEIQEQVLFVFSNRKEPASLDKLFAVAKNDPNKEMKKKAIFWIGQRRNDPRAAQFLLDLLK